MYMTCLPQHLLKFVEIDSATVLDHIVNDQGIYQAEDAMVSNSARIAVRVANGAKIFVMAKSHVYKCFFDT